MHTDDRPDRVAQLAYLHLMWCAWMNLSWDDLDAEQRAAVAGFSQRIVDEDLPALAASVYGLTAQSRTSGGGAG